MAEPRGARVVWSEPGQLVQVPKTTPEQAAAFRAERIANLRKIGKSDPEIRGLVGDGPEFSSLKEFNPNHDDRGRFATGGGGGVLVGNSSLSRSTGLSMSQVADMKRAVADTVARDPEITHAHFGGSGLKVVGFASQTPPGVSDAAWKNEVAYSSPTAWAETHADVAGASSEAGTHIVVNDQNGMENTTGWNSVPNAYGVMTHELGHAWFDAYGVKSVHDAQALVRAYGIMPQDVDEFSHYGATGAREALAEMYSAKYAGASVGVSMRDSVAARFDALEQGVLTHTAPETYGGGNWGWQQLLMPGTPLAERALAAARQNLAAGDWVASGPEGALEDAVSKRLSDGRLKEFNPNHDERGRFATGGGSASWPSTQAEFDAMTQDPRNPDLTASGEKITPDTPLIVFHGGEREATQGYIQNGIHAADKPMTLGRENYESGEYAEFQPGSGLSGGFYVTSDDNQGSGYGYYRTAVLTTAGALSQPPESTNPKTGLAGVLSDLHDGGTGAVILGDVPAENVRLFGTDLFMMARPEVGNIQPAGVATYPPSPPEVIRESEIDARLGRLEEQLGVEPLREFNPNHDAKGEFTFGAGPAHQIQITAQGTAIPTVYTDADRAALRQAVDAAVARSPEIGENLAKVSYLSNPPVGLTPEVMDIVKQGGMSTTPAPYGEKYIIVVNDGVHATDGNSPDWAFTKTTLGEMTHELGHVYLNAHGFSTDTWAAKLLEHEGIGPNDLADGGSRYGASNPSEAFAEMYGAKYGGGSMPDALSTKFDAVLHDVSSGWTPDYALGTGTWKTGLPLPGTPLMERAEKAAAANIAAGRWLVDESLKEFNPNHDEKGRFATGGDGAIATPTGGKNQAGLDAAEVQSHLLAINARNPNRATDANWYQTQHDLINQRASALGIDPQRFTGMVAAVSPRISWETAHGKLPNLDAATKAALFGRDMPAGVDAHEYAAELEHPGMLRNNLGNALEIYQGRPVGEVLTSPKVASFYNNLEYPGKTDSVTVDTWMARVLASVTDTSHYASNPAVEAVLKGTGKNSGYAWAADQVRAAAATAGMSPDAFQASVWSQYQREVGSGK